MAEGEMGAIHQKIYALCKGSDRKERSLQYMKLGEAIALWQDGKVVILPAAGIPQFDKDSQIR